MARAALFDVQKAAVSKHLKNIYVSGELAQEATVSKMETVQQEGARKIKYEMSEKSKMQKLHIVNLNSCH